MPLLDPPSVGVLAALPTKKTAGLTLHRVFSARRPDPWFFSSIPDGGVPAAYGRFDLPAPDGACYTATSAIGAVLETFQHFAGGLVADSELRTRVRAETVAPSDSPTAANLTAARARAVGIHAGLWADPDRAKTQAWADQLRRAGHRALHHGIGHEPTGRLRAVTFFDKAGTHPPYGDDAGWATTRHPLHTDPGLRAALGRYGVTVTRSDPNLPVVTLDHSGLL